MQNTRRQLTTAALAVGAALLLGGCTGSGGHDDGLPKDYGHDWLDQMSTRFSGDNGGGGGRLEVDDADAKEARAAIALQDELAGPYDVLVVCRSTTTVHVTIRDFTAKHSGHGDSLDPRSEIGAADVRCGTTVRIPIDVPAGRDGIMLDASTRDTSGRALFDTFVVTRGSEH
ncbi:hypothetical protein ACLBWP_03040 [Microbacterium sp. M1A1_1b]